MSEQKQNMLHTFGANYYIASDNSFALSSPFMHLNLP